MVGNLAQANVMVKADAKMAFASVTHSSVVTIAHKVYVHFCVVAMAFMEEANVTVWMVGKVRNVKYGIRNVSLRIVPETDVVAKAFAFVMPDGMENIVRNETVRTPTAPVTEFAKMQPAFATLDGWDQIVSYATKFCINACLIVPVMGCSMPI
jgi:hypothetical protein